MIFYPEIYFPKGILRKINIIAKDADKVKTSSTGSEISGCAMVQKMPLLKNTPITKMWTK